MGATSKKTPVKILRAYSMKLHGKSPDTLSDRAAELFAVMGGDAATLQRPVRFDRGEAVFLFHGRQGALCAVLSVSVQASGFCSTTLREADGRVSVGVTVIAGRTFLWGLVANTVQNVNVTVAGSTSRGQIANNALIVRLPDGSRGTGPILLTGRDRDGATVTHRLPGIPKPPS